MLCQTPGKRLAWSCAAVVLLCKAARAQTEPVGFATTDTASSFDAALTEIPTNSRASYPTDYSPALLTATNSSAPGASTTYTSASISISQNGTGLTSVPTSRSTSSSTTTSQYALLSGSGNGGTPTSTPSGIVGVSCNGYPELCGRKYSNVTYVMAHNSPFVVPHNAASNQAFHVTTQLNDGIRGLEFETHMPNASSPIMLCHTSCDELNVGPLEDYLVTVRQWLDENRYEVITIVMGNDDFVDPGNYTAPFVNSGMIDYLYVPKYVPMGLDGWPTLSEMILTNKRVVVMLDYDANQKEIPWLLEQWNYLFQTPFSPTNDSFPCTVQRPPNQPTKVSADRLYTANHNLNLPIDDTALGLDFLVPYWPKLPTTNANYTNVEGAAGTMVDGCTALWGRPPNFLLVDYYNYGNFNGSTLATGAEANNVTYYPDSCCGRSSPYVSEGSRPYGMQHPERALAIVGATLLSLML